MHATSPRDYLEEKTIHPTRAPVKITILPAMRRLPRCGSADGRSRDSKGNGRPSTFCLDIMRKIREAIGFGKLSRFRAELRALRIRPERSGAGDPRGRGAPGGFEVSIGKGRHLRKVLSAEGVLSVLPDRQ